MNDFIDIKLGDLYPVIDEYALNGHHIRGFMASFKYSSLTIDIIKGQSARAIQGDPSDNAMFISNIDSTSDFAIRDGTVS